MKNFTRLFVVNNGECSGWTDATRTSFVIAVESDKLRVTVKKGRDPYAYEINTAFGKFLQAYEKENGKVERRKRTHHYRFCYRDGSSGCRDTFIEIDVGDGFPERKFLMHESMYGKCGGFCCDVYDFLDLCVAYGALCIVCSRYYYYDIEEDTKARELEMSMIRPRLTEYEEGWTDPRYEANYVVYLKTCREKPEESTSSDSDKEKEEEA